MIVGRAVGTFPLVADLKMFPRSLGVDDRIFAVDKQSNESTVPVAQRYLEIVEGRAAAVTRDEPWHTTTESTFREQGVKRLAISELLIPRVAATLDEDAMPRYQRTPPRSPRVQS